MVFLLLSSTLTEWVFNQDACPNQWINFVLLPLKNQTLTSLYYLYFSVQLNYSQMYWTHMCETGQDHTSHVISCLWPLCDRKFLLTKVPGPIPACISMISLCFLLLRIPFSTHSPVCVFDGSNFHSCSKCQSSIWSWSFSASSRAGEHCSSLPSSGLSWLSFHSFLSLCLSPLTLSLPNLCSISGKHFALLLPTYTPPACSHIPNWSHTSIISLNRTHFFLLGIPEHTHTCTHGNTSVPFQYHWQEDKQQPWEVTMPSKKRGKNSKSSQGLK